MDKLRRWLTNLPVLLAGLLLLGAAGAWLMTRGGETGRITAKPASATERVTAIDSQLLESARQLASLAETDAELELAREALRLADHELDQAFEMALREASGTRLPATGPLREIAQHIAELEAQVAADQKRIAQLNQPSAAKPAGDGETSQEAQTQLAKARLALDQDELDDARQDLARKGGDEHGRLQVLAEAHQAAQKGAAPLPKVLTPAPVGTFREQLNAWFGWNDKSRAIATARQQALNRFALLARAHAGMESSAKQAAAPGETRAEADEAAALERLRGLSGRTRTKADLDRRINDTLQLADVYRRWGELARASQRAVLHLVLGSAFWILAILLAVLGANRVIRGLLGRNEDRSRLHQQRTMARLAVNVVATMLVLLIIYGPPQQTSTIIGLATAGLTVVMKDFIVAFLGWFILMGKNGIRLGDWVEINGVSGEVIELGIFRTHLLEMGNWGTTAHPTGRRVGFSNSFAVEGKYFNFSTAGQWMWDELSLALPSAGDPYRTAGVIREAVERATEESSRLAAADWERVSRETGTAQFSAQPAVEVRVGAKGAEALVRYITRGPQRYETKAKLQQQLLEVLRAQSGPEAGTASPAIPAKA